MNYLVYKHTSPSGKSYIGFTCDYDRRCKQHISQQSECTAFRNAIQKYGWESFTHEILYTELTLEEACEIEQHLIEHLNTLSPHGYNLTTGGDGGRLLSEETKRKMSESRRGRQISDHCRESTRLRMTGRHVSAATKQKLSEARKRHSGWCHSEETKRKIGERHKGKSVPDHIRDSMAKTYKITSPDGEVFFVMNAMAFAKEHNLNGDCLTACARGTQKRHRGWMCEFHPLPAQQHA